ncbi:hypothetical protein F4804DRAFT_237330 [Jackrogersella minutella]|nr:hypothetical protein F4804DRAFT_237330 [Jackrogersella minutella]
MTDMILPKGIVFNKSDIYGEIAKYDIVPLEQILAACHVFATTSRKLVDPTARRLENFWTRVLGGDRRYLPGRIIAKLFQNISEERSFVKLRGPSNRYEPPSPDSKAESPPRVQANPETSGEGSSGSRPKGKAKSTKSTPSSSTKQPHPILKKPRGPSSSGPRPTARFVSPKGSDVEGEDSKDAELASSGSTAVNQSGDSRGYTSSTAKEERKKTTNPTPKKKSTAFVASTATRRRPAMPRRISSQSSSAVGGSEVGPKDGGSSSGSKHSGSQSSVPTIPENPSRGEASTTKDGSERPSTKAAGKRPATRTSLDTSKTAQSGSSQTSNADNRQLAGQVTSSEAKQPESSTDSTNKTEVDDVKRVRAGQSGTAHRRSDTQERPRPNIPPVMTRSRSDLGSSRRSSQELTGGIPPPHSMIASSTTTVSNTTAQGTIIEFDENPLANEAIMRGMQGHEEDVETSSRRSGSSVLDARFTPTQPSAMPTVPLGRSKSQLTLLLERNSEKKPRR